MSPTVLGSNNVKIANKNSGAGSIPVGTVKPAISYTEQIWLTLIMVTVLGSFFLASLLLSYNQKVNLAAEENRTAISFPAIGPDFKLIEAFPKSFESFFNDRLPFKSQLVGLRNVVKLKLFLASGSEKVIVGQHGFLFYADEGDQYILRQEKPFSVAELRQWEKVLEERTQWCKKLGSDYYVAIAPSKASILPEMVPTCCKRINNHSRLDQLASSLYRHSKINFIDLRDALVFRPDRDKLYFKTDSHWNKLGAFYAYQLLINRIRKQNPAVGEPWSMEKYQLEPYSFTHGDLARLLGLYGTLDESSVLLEPRQGNLYSTVNVPLRAIDLKCSEERRPFATVVSNQTLPQAVIIRDSFANGLRKYLPNHFSRATYYWQFDFDRSIIEQQKPQIVIHEFTERMLYLPVPEN